MSRPRAADDFATIRGRLEELRRERLRQAAGAATTQPGSRDEPHDDIERRHRDRREGRPPPWVPTIFLSRRF